ncbi:MAG TPA: MFS transporter [Pirellulales bacterium]|nr:MFS transporter [Pirellulales bacterium]
MHVACLVTLAGAALAQTDSAVSIPPLTPDMWIRLSVLQFMEFAIWGAWWVVLGQYLEGLHFTRKGIGNVYATMSLGSIIAPMFVGAIADRYFAGEHVMAALQLTGAALLFWLAHITHQRFFYWVMLVYALLFAPTISFVNPLTLAHIPEADRADVFPLIRLWGTIGWIAANLFLKLLLKPGQPVSNRPILLAATLSLVMGIFSFWLPHTPPSPDSEALPFVEALSLLKEPSIAIFFGVALLVAMAASFYFGFVAIFLEKKVGVRSDNVGPLTTIGQWVELGAMFMVGWSLNHFGMKWVLAIGMAAWGLRFGFFSLGKPFALVLLGVALHGFCFDFFFVASFIHVANTAPQSIINSGQTLFGMLTYGVGMYLGTEASGWLNQRLTREVVDPATGVADRVTDWRTFWLIPAVTILISVVLFVLLFSNSASKHDVDATIGAAASQTDFHMLPVAGA